MSRTQLEIFCGTGGVGKTTLSLTRALYLSEYKKLKVALITIDPAKRLKDLVGIKDEDSGLLVTKKIEGYNSSLDIMLMNPEVTFNKIRSKELQGQENRILGLLMTPYGGMNEIMSVVELKRILDQEDYDTIVLDTPPGSHFIDFLESLKKIDNFFDSSWIEIFNALSQKVEDQMKSTNFLKELASSGIKKILSYLESVTGKEFLTEFVASIAEFYRLKDTFLAAIKLQENFQDSNNSSWYLVTAADQTKLSQAKELVNKSSVYTNNQIQIIVNRTIGEHLTNDNTKVATYFKNNEKNLIESLTISGNKPQTFPEVISDKFITQLRELVNNWNKHESK